MNDLQNSLLPTDVPAAWVSKLRKIEHNLLEQLTLACHILYMEGQNDVNHGQVSARIPGDSEFWVRGAALGFDEVEPVDFVRVDLQGKVLQGHRVIPPEWPIHVEIYRARPDVNAIVHTHAPSAVAFSCLEEELLPIGHEGCPFYKSLNTFKVTTNTLLTREMAAKMLVDLADNTAVLLKNHGIVVVGRSIKQATVLAIMLEQACAAQLRMPAGKHLSASPQSDVAEKNRFIFSRLAVATYWDYYSRKLARIKQGTQLARGW